MTWLLGILEWFAGQILQYLLGKASDAAADKLKQIEEDQKRGEVNDANVKAYEEANDRESRIRAATDLLNRVRRAP